MEFAEEFDGIWASASLLHVPRAQLDDALRRLLRAAKDRGVIYMSFKRGVGERVKDGRLFTDFTQKSHLTCQAKRMARREADAI